MPTNLTERVQQFLKNRREPKADISGENRISVNEAVGAIAFYYEKIRNVVDYQDEHLIRQNAIRRILGRRMIVAEAHEEIALGLLKELVRYRYFPNNTLSFSTVGRIAKILHLYLGVMRELSERRELSDKDKDWLISMAACSIDEELVPMVEERSLVQLMYQCLEPNVSGKNGATDDPMRKLQIYIAVYRTLLRPDIDRLRHLLLVHNFIEWKNVESPDIQSLANDYHSTAQKVDSIIRHPLNKKLLPSFRRFRIPFVVLFTLVRNGQEDILQNPELLEKEITRICEGFYAVQKKRLYGRTVRAFIYIFLTKMALGLALELPYDLITIHRINMVPLFVNIIFPPMFLAAMIAFVKFPGKDNTRAIIQAVKEVVYKDSEQKVFVPQSYKTARTSIPMLVVFYTLYVLLFALSFGFVGWLLHKLDFNIVSAIVFIVFFCLISFFGINLRRSVLDLVILKPKIGLLGTLIESLFLPIVSVGRWLSFNISRVNIFVFIFDVLIELPLQALLEITEQWFAFLKEKKEELE